MHRGREPDLYFWRDTSGHEVDLIVEIGGEPVPVEIKSAQTFSRDFLQGLAYWRGLAGQPEGPAALAYGGDASYLRQGVAVRSWRTWG